MKQLAIPSRAVPRDASEEIGLGGAQMNDRTSGR